ncbi:MAG: hypothetical protein AB8H80_05445 [Planctomycetota bacterium]
MRHRFRNAAAAAAAGWMLAALGACHAPMELPAGFVELRDMRGENAGFRAVTSDDARLWLRDLYEPTDGGVDFWIESLRRDFVEQRGHLVVDAGEVDDHHGQKGRWLQLRADSDDGPVGYLVAVWDVGDCVRVVEFAAAQEVFDARVAAVRKALQSVR